MGVNLMALDDALTAVNARYFASESSLRSSWRLLERGRWVYGELQLEGISVFPQDLERAFSNETGVDHYDSVRLKRIRRLRDVLGSVQEAAQLERSLDFQMLCDWQRLLAGEPECQLRRAPSATEQYKHETVPASQILALLDALLTAINRDELPELHVVSNAIAAMARMGQIWPFQRCSGSLLRLVGSYVLLRNGYPPLILSPRDRREFYQSLHQETDRLEGLVVQALWDGLRVKEEFLTGRLNLQRLWGAVEGNWV